MAFHADSQHDSLTTLIFAIENKIEEYYKNFEIPDEWESESMNIEFYYPILIFQGPLYTAEIKDGNVSLHKTEHVQFRKQYFYKSKEVTYQIDVINESYLSSFLKIIDREMEEVAKTFKKYRRVVKKSIDRLADEMRVKAKKKSLREILEF